MDDRRVDALSRILSTSPTRRAALWTLASLGVFRRNALDEALAKKKGNGNGKKGKKGKNKKPSPPPPPPPDPTGNDCFYLGYHSGCTGVPGKPCCYNNECRACAPEGNCGCTEPLICSSGETENVCIMRPE
jgi:hypothetical protein